MEQIEQQLQSQALTWPEKARAITIADQQTYDQATELLKGTAALEKEIKAHYGPLKQEAHEAHKKITAAEKSVLAPVQEASGILRSSVAQYASEQERLRREEERRLAEIARKEEEERRLSEAIEAEANGATVDEVEAVIERPSIAPMPRVQPAYMPTKGISTREIWHAEVTNIRELARAVADGRAAPTLIQPNMTALNGLARSLKRAMNTPGVKAVVETTTAVRAS